MPHSRTPSRSSIASRDSLTFISDLDLKNELKALMQFFYDNSTRSEARSEGSVSHANLTAIKRISFSEMIFNKFSKKEYFDKYNGLKELLDNDEITLPHSELDYFERRLDILLGLLEECEYDNDILTEIIQDSANIDALYYYEDESGEYSHDDESPELYNFESLNLRQDTDVVIDLLVKLKFFFFTDKQEQNQINISIKDIHKAISSNEAYEYHNHYYKLYNKEWFEVCANLVLNDLIVNARSTNGNSYGIAKEFLMALSIPGQTPGYYRTFAAHLKIYDIRMFDIEETEDSSILNYKSQDEYLKELILRTQLVIEISKTSYSRAMNRLFNALSSPRDKKLSRYFLEQKAEDNDIEPEEITNVPPAVQQVTSNPQESSPIEEVLITKGDESLTSLRSLAVEVLDQNKQNFKESNNTALILNTLRYLSLPHNTLDDKNSIENLIRFRQNLNTALIFMFQDISLAIKQDYPKLRVNKNLIKILWQIVFEYQCVHDGKEDDCTHCQRATKMIAECEGQLNILHTAKVLAIPSLTEYFNFVISRCVKLNNTRNETRLVAMAMMQQNATLMHSSNYDRFKNNTSVGTQTEDTNPKDAIKDLRPLEKIADNGISKQPLQDRNNIKLHIANHALKVVAAGVLALSNTGKAIWSRASFATYAMIRLMNIARLTYELWYPSKIKTWNLPKAKAWLFELAETIIVSSILGLAACQGYITIALDVSMKLLMSCIGSLVLSATGYLRASKQLSSTAASTLPSRQLDIERGNQVTVTDAVDSSVSSSTVPTAGASSCC